MKKILLPALLLLSAPAFSQCSDLFFSEYLEGSSNNKAIEIYNPTSAAINLTDYVIYRYNNGSPTPSDSLFPQDILAAGDVWVAGNPSAVAAVLNESDTLHTITFFNGDDAMSLKKISTNTVLDIIGAIGFDPGTNWPVGTGATSEFTLVRMVGIQQGNVTWATAANEYDVYAQNTFTFLGNHTMTACCVTPTTVFLQSFTSNPCFGDSVGTIAVTGQGDGPYAYSWVNLPDTTSSLSGLPAGTYSAVVTGPCVSDTMEITIVEPPALTATTTQVNPNCFGFLNGAAYVNVSGGVGPYQYSWSPPNGNNYSISGVPAGVYVATTTDDNGCTRTDSFTITEPDSLGVMIVSQADPTCNGDTNGTVTISVYGGTSPYTYLWASGGTDTTETGLGMGAGSVAVLDSGGCSAGVSFYLNEPPPVPVMLFAGPTPLCWNSGTHILNGGSPLGGYYSGTNVVSDSVFVTSDTGWNDITYTYTDTNGCTASVLDSIWVNPCLGIDEVLNENSSVAPNPFASEFRITFASAALRTIEVLNVHGEVVKAFTTNDSQSTIDMSALADGMYIVRVSDGAEYENIRVQKLH